MKQKYIIILDKYDGCIEAVGQKGGPVMSKRAAKRFSSLRRALNAAQGWGWYSDKVRVVPVSK